MRILLFIISSYFDVSIDLFCPKGLSFNFTQDSVTKDYLTNQITSSKMPLMKRPKHMNFLLCYFLLLSGCASVLVAGASGGVAYTITNVAYKTIVAPIDQVEFANRLALIKMGIKQVEREETGNVVKIFAETSELKIHIDLEEITPRTTKISVDAAKNVVVKDKATAAAIIEQTEEMLEH